FSSDRAGPPLETTGLRLYSGRPSPDRGGGLPDSEEGFRERAEAFREIKKGDLVSRKAPRLSRRASEFSRKPSRLSRKPSLLTGEASERSREAHPLVRGGTPWRPGRRLPGPEGRAPRAARGVRGRGVERVREAQAPQHRGVVLRRLGAPA